MSDTRTTEHIARRISIALKELYEVETDKTSDAARIAELRAFIGEQILGHYDRFMAKGKKPVAAVRNGVCQECFIRLSTGAAAKLLHEDDISLCEQCGRYLYLEETPVEIPLPAEKKPRKKRLKQPA
jgi:predicted  nucleic acid-binding Zn-ribbon protein